MDLHFWRKICKVCKCSKDSHNVEDDDITGWVQFQLLGTKPVKTKGLNIPALGNKDLHLEWTPPGASAAVERYLHDMPSDQIPISGSDAAKKRQQRLQNQIPAHDLDATLCDSLSAAEQTKMEEYISHIRKHCVGQGQLVELPVYLAGKHEMNEPYAKLVLDHPHSQIANSEIVELKQAGLANQLSNLNLHNKNCNVTKIDPNIGNNSIPQQTCHECLEIFDEGGIAINISRTEAQWHPQCFKCHTCRQPLEDLLYFFDKKSQNVYCGRDYAKIKGIPRCGACDELIFTSEYCLAEERAFHVKHFCCWECDIPLAGLQYLIEDQNPMCLPCFEKLKAAWCQQCGVIIGPDQRGAVLEGLHWHTPECFVCRKCSKSLMGEKLLLRKGHIYCSGSCVALDS